MTPHESLFPALSQIEAAGASVRLVDGKPQLFGDVQNVPSDARAFLREHIGELVAYLASAGRPDPDPVLFVSRRLAVHELPAGWVRGVRSFGSGINPTSA
jgi:hypothetical protein